MCPEPACDQVFECGSVFNSGAVLTNGTEKLAVGESTLHTGCAHNTATGASRMSVVSRIVRGERSPCFSVPVQVEMLSPSRRRLPLFFPAGTRLDLNCS